MFKLRINLSWLVWLSGLNTSLRTKGSPVRFPGQDTCLGCRPGSQRGAHERQPHTDVSLLFSLPPFPFSKSKLINFFFKESKQPPPVFESQREPRSLLFLRGQSGQASQRPPDAMGDRGEPRHRGDRDRPSPVLLTPRVGLLSSPFSGSPAKGLRCLPRKEMVPDGGVQVGEAARLTRSVAWLPMFTWGVGDLPLSSRAEPWKVPAEMPGWSLGPRAHRKLVSVRQTALSHAPCRRSGEEGEGLESPLSFGARTEQGFSGAVAGSWDSTPAGQLCRGGGSTLHLKSRGHVVLSLVPGRQPACPGLPPHPVLREVFLPRLWF